jgi:lysophospholipase L1-like esterase
VCCAETRAATGLSGPPSTPSPRIETPEWWQQRHENMNARVKQGNVDLIFIGDSITQRWEQDGRHVWDKYYRPRNAVNLGIDGDRTQQVLWRLDHGNIDGISPKLADDKMVFYIDISRGFLGKNGSLRNEAFAPDAVHLSAKGYEIWAEAIEPMVKRLMEVAMP